MRILADENCDGLLVQNLRSAGHDVKSIRESSLGAADEAVLRLAADEARVLLTNDLDFALEVERDGALPPAIVLMRLHPLTVESRSDIVVRFLSTRELKFGRIYVIEPGQIRDRAFESA